VRGGRVRAHALDAFCDALWLEDGLAQNTIAAYRADLEQLEAFLGADLLAADGIGGFGHATGGYLLEAKRWLLMHECGADAFELTP